MTGITQTPVMDLNICLKSLPQMRQYTASHHPYNTSPAATHTFASEKEAWDYANYFFCPSCKKKYAQGIKDTFCAAEWLIVPSGCSNNDAKHT